MALKALVIDDHSTDLEIMQDVFSMQGVSCRTTDDPSQAAELLSQEKFDAVFTDLNLPQLDGIGLIRRIRQSTGNAHTPVIVISGGDAKVREQAFRAGGTF